MATKSNTVTRSIRATTEPAQAATARAERIRRDAYEIFRARGTNGSPGDALTDWLQAERELRESDQREWQR